MSEVKPKELFNEKLMKHIRDARKLNNEPESKDNDIYYHPTESRVVKKSLDLTSPKPMGRFRGREPKSSSEERWLEAYLIRKAKRNDWMLQSGNKQYRLLYSQLKCRREDETQGEKHRALDLLLYDEEDKNLVILELKSIRQLKKAKEELDYYERKVNECKNGLIKAFGLDEIRGIVSYIVWPAGSGRGRRSPDVGKYGLIEYTKIPNPWEAFKEAGKQGKDLEIKFTCRRPAQ